MSPNYLGEELGGEARHPLILELIIEALMNVTFPVYITDYCGYSS